jgi:acyl-coenzyme A synthetase/AMP-(fatty) acid ligase
VRQQDYIKTRARELTASLRAIIAECEDRDTKRYVYTELARMVNNLARENKFKPDKRRVQV